MYSSCVIICISYSFIIASKKDLKQGLRELQQDYVLYIYRKPTKRDYTKQQNAYNNKFAYNMRG